MIPLNFILLLRHYSDRATMAPTFYIVGMKIDKQDSYTSDCTSLISEKDFR